nr:NADH dehydrogenase subunit 4 [Rhynchopus humris]
MHAILLLLFFLLDECSSADSVWIRGGIQMLWWIHSITVLVDDFFIFYIIFIYVFFLSTCIYMLRDMIATVEYMYIGNSMLLASTAAVITDDALLFFLSFEGMLLLIQWYLMQYVTSSRSLYALLLLTGYTIIGSALLLTGMSYYYLASGMCMSTYALPVYTTTSAEYAVCVVLHAGCCCKLPCYPLHAWLLEAHVESSTDASILLAGIFLKVGLLGWWRYLLYLHPYSLHNGAPIYILLLLLAVATLCILLSVIGDIKRYAAVSSILHMMSSVTAILLHTDIHTRVGGTVLLIMHSFIAAHLFLVIGTSYEHHGVRYHTHLRVDGSMWWCYLLILLYNVGYPLCCAYYGELMLVGGCSRSIAILSMSVLAIGCILSCTGLMLWASVGMGREVVDGVDTASMYPYTLLVLLLGGSIYPCSTFSTTYPITW